MPGREAALPGRRGARLPFPALPCASAPSGAGPGRRGAPGGGAGQPLRPGPLRELAQVSLSSPRRSRRGPAAAGGLVPGRGLRRRPRARSPGRPARWPALLAHVPRSRRPSPTHIPLVGAGLASHPREPDGIGSEGALRRGIKKKKPKKPKKPINQGRPVAGGGWQMCIWKRRGEGDGGRRRRAEQGKGAAVRCDAGRAGGRPGRRRRAGGGRAERGAPGADICRLPS